jgi:type IV fimbrial biogenesis protein FimT
MIEIVLVITILALLLAAALPGFSRARERADLRLSAVSFGEDLRRAFVLAIARDQRVVFCPLADPGAEHCGSGSAFDHGWLAFYDEDGDRERSPSEPILLRNAPSSPHLRIRSSEGRPRVVIQPDGGNRGTNATFLVCGRLGVATATSVVLSNDGRIRYAQPSPVQVAERCR